MPDASSASQRFFVVGYLVSRTLSLLVDMALEDVKPDVYGLTKLPVPVRRKLVQLATVNSTFFYAAVPILWNTMFSLRPLLALLHGSKRPKHVKFNPSIVSPLCCPWPAKHLRNPGIRQRNLNRTMDTL